MSTSRCNCCDADLCGCTLRDAPKLKFDRVATVEFLFTENPVLSEAVTVHNVPYSFTLRPHQNFGTIADFRAIAAAAAHLESIGETRPRVVNYITHKAA